MPIPLEHIVRLIYPFRLDAGGLDKAVETLTQLRHLSQKDAPKKTWHEAASVPALYREEILPQVTQVLFGYRHGTNRYLRIDAETLSTWFPDDGQMVPDPQKTVDEADRPHYPLKLAGEGIELFLSPHGVGLLSLTFASRISKAQTLQAINHHLSQLRRPTTYLYQTPQDAQTSGKPSELDTPFEQRLGTAGGSFLLEELVDFLLAPLHRNFGLEETQQQLSVYSVTRFDPQVKFAAANSLDPIRPILAALTHVKDATHQGSIGLRKQLLDAEHWAAISNLGAAHIIADQDPQRLTRSLYSYFVPYLCATLQRLILQRLLWDTDQAVLETEGSLPERQAKLHKLQQDMLNFSIQGYFTEVSSREALNQYYELAQHGLRVEQSLQLAQRVLHDLESTTTAAFQLAASKNAQVLAKAVGTHTGLLVDVRRKVEWLEVFFVAYFAITLVHYVGDGLFSEHYLHWSTMAAPFLSALIALLFIRPYASHAQYSQEATTRADIPAKQKGQWLLLGALALLTAGWVSVGYLFFPSENHAVQGASFLCASGANCAPKAAEGTI